MHHSYALMLKKTVNVQNEGDDLLLIGYGRKAIRLSQPGAALTFLLSELKLGYMTADQLCNAAAEEDADTNLTRLYYVLECLKQKGFVCYVLANGREKLATLDPISPAFTLLNALPNVGYRLSRFACLRRLEDDILLECPLGHARLFVHDSNVGAAITLLTTPHTVVELTAKLPALEGFDVYALLSMLCSVGAVFTCSEDGAVMEDDSAALRQWAFHDLLFHSRSRAGRHEEPLGGTFRFRDSLPPLPATKAPMSNMRIDLYKPDMATLEANDLSFSRVSELRRSIRCPAEQAISAVQLGEFLYRTARIKTLVPVDPTTGACYEHSRRVCPGGGAMHELELYLSISRCKGIASGFYHYDPLNHALEHLSELDFAQRKLLSDSAHSSGLQTSPDVLITLAARFGRPSWKYQSMAYALILKDTGVLYQQMYLVATAMNLAACGIGAGDSDHFAKVTRLDYYTESSVGEFMLSNNEQISRERG